MAHRILILGGGFGGLATATALRDALRGSADFEAVVVDRRESFLMGLRKLWALVGQATLDEGRRPLDAAAGDGVRILRADITRIDPEARRVETDAGTLEADYLVIALGAEPDPDRVPGLAEYAFNLYDPDAIPAAASRVAALDAGHVVVCIAGLPYKCPPAPYEAAMLLDDHFRRRGIRDRVRLTLTTLQPMLLPNAGPDGARWIGEELTRRGIEYRVGAKVLRIESGRILTAGDALPFDLALVAPPHRVPDVVRDSGLTGDGDWIRVDPATLQTAWPRVFAIGDVTHIPLANDMPLPKAGIFAEAEGRHVADAIAADIARRPAPAPFDGRGACFLEMGAGRAALVQGDFFARPAPVLRIAEPSTQNMDDKRRFEAERLARWFRR